MAINKPDFTIPRYAANTGPSVGEILMNYSKELATKERQEKLDARQAQEDAWNQKVRAQQEKAWTRQDAERNANLEYSKRILEPANIMDGAATDYAVASAGGQNKLPTDNIYGGMELTPREILITEGKLGESVTPEEKVLIDRKMQLQSDFADKLLAEAPKETDLMHAQKAARGLEWTPEIGASLDSKKAADLVAKQALEKRYLDQAAEQSKRADELRLEAKKFSETGIKNSGVTSSSGKSGSTSGLTKEQLDKKLGESIGAYLDGPVAKSRVEDIMDTWKASNPNASTKEIEKARGALYGVVVEEGFNRNILTDADIDINTSPEGKQNIISKMNRDLTSSGDKVIPRMTASSAEAERQALAAESAAKTAREKALGVYADPYKTRVDQAVATGGLKDYLAGIDKKLGYIAPTKEENKVIEEKSRETVVDPNTVKTYDPKVDTDTATKISTSKDLNIVGANPTGIKDYSKRPKMTNVTGGVIHRTGGGDRDPKSMENDSYITSGKGDAHYYINSDGTIVSLIPENVKAYHSGDNRNANNIGIEVAGFHSSQFTKGDKNYNPSIEKAVIKKYGKLPDWSSTGGWEPMTKAQEAATLKLTGNLNEKYGLSYDKYSAHLKNGTEGADVLKFLQGSGKNGNAKKMTSNEIIEEYGKATDKDLSGVWTGMPDYNEGRYSKVAGKVDSTLFGDHITTRNISRVANQLRKDGFNTTEQISNLLIAMPEGMDKKLVTARLNEKMAQENTLVPFEPGMVNGLIKEFVLDKKDITYKDGKVYIPYNTLKKIDAVKDATLLAAETIVSATPVGAGFKVATKFKPMSSALHLTPVGTAGKEASKKQQKR